MVENTLEAEQRIWAQNNPNTPEGSAYWASRRLEVVVREKEELERRERQNEKRIEALEQFRGKFAGVDDDTLTWLAKADKSKLEKVDNAIQFLANMEFMGKWSRRGFLALIFGVASVAGAITWLKSNVPFQR